MSTCASWDTACKAAQTENNAAESHNDMAVGRFMILGAINALWATAFWYVDAASGGLGQTINFDTNAATFRSLAAINGWAFWGVTLFLGLMAN